MKTNKSKRQAFETRAIVNLQGTDETTKSVTTPIYPSVNYCYAEPALISAAASASTPAPTSPVPAAASTSTPPPAPAPAAASTSTPPPAPVPAAASTSTSTSTSISPPPFSYMRSNNPNRQLLEHVLADLEEGTHALCFSSGMAALSAMMALLRPGDHIVTTTRIYGGTIDLLEKILPQWDIRTTFVETPDVQSFADALTAQTRLVLLETPSNPLLHITDVAAVCEMVRARTQNSRKPSESDTHTQKARIWVALDNTFATPFLQRPLSLGVDLVFHSMTKYLGGHSDVLGGAIITNDENLHVKLKAQQKNFGGVPSPFDCWLVQRGIKTLALRMQRHQENAQAVADFLAASDMQSVVHKVHYPGLATHAGHEIAKRQMSGFGGMVSVELKLPVPALLRFLTATKIFTLAESLGGVESLIGYPARMSHVGQSPQWQQRAGIRDTLVRLSVGIEAKSDLIGDLQQALALATAATSTATATAATSTATAKVKD